MGTDGKEERDTDTLIRRQTTIAHRASAPCLWRFYWHEHMLMVITPDAGCLSEKISQSAGGESSRGLVHCQTGTAALGRICGSESVFSSSCRPVAPLAGPAGPVCLNGAFQWAEARNCYSVITSRTSLRHHARPNQRRQARLLACTHADSTDACSPFRVHHTQH